jgi:hypothetical protein
MGISEKLRRLIIVSIYIFPQQGSPGDKGLSHPRFQGQLFILINDS